MVRKRKRVAVLLAIAAVFFSLVAFLAFNANRIIRFELARRLGRDFSVGSISLGPGGVEAGDVKVKRDGEIFLEADRIVIRADILGVLRKQYVISKVTFEKPVLHMKTDRAGKLVNPFIPTTSSARGGGKGMESGQEKGEMPPIEIKRIAIRDGKLFYRDGKVATPPHVTRLEAIQLDIENIHLPLDQRWTKYTLSARVPGNTGDGSLRGNGKTNCKTLDTDAKITLDRLDITGFKPYFRKKGDADVVRGSLDIAMGLNIRSKIINGPGRAVLRDLEFASGKGLGDRFIGVPRSMVIKLLKTGDNEIALNFVMTGNIDDPKFSIAESLMTRLTVGLAKGLGLTVVDAGKTVVEIGAKGAQEVGKGIKGIGAGIQKLFGK